MWTLADNQGTVHDLVDSTGTIQNHITYDSFGQITGETNPAIDTRFGYTGREFDAETGQYYYRARYYDPEVSKFISEDPAGFMAEQANLYRYVDNSPVNFTDPSGLIAANLVGAGIGGSFDLGLQLASNGGNISKVDWASVAVSTATGSLGVGLTAKIASLSTSAGKRIAWNAAGNAVLGAGDRVVRNALEGNCLGDNVLTSALVSGALGAASEGVSLAAPRFISSSSGALGSVDDAARSADNAAVGVLDDLGGGGEGNVSLGSSSSGGGLPRFTYRGDTRPPEEIFETGLQPWNPNGNLTLSEHVYGINEITLAPVDLQDSQWVSTSFNATAAKGFANPAFTGGYVYAVRPRMGADVNATLGIASRENEFAVLGGVQVGDVLGVRRVDAYDRFTGPFILNPRFTK